MQFVNDGRLWCIWDGDGDVIARFPNKDEAQLAFEREWAQEDDADKMTVDRACALHPMQIESECDCHMDGPYSDDRGEFGPGAPDGYSART